MSKKDTGLNDALSFIMGKTAEAAPQELGPQYGHKIDIIEPQNSHNMAIERPKKTARRSVKEKLENHHIGLYPDDWKALESIAEAEGGNVSVLIRRAVKAFLSSNTVHR